MRSVVWVLLVLMVLSGRTLPAATTNVTGFSKPQEIKLIDEFVRTGNVNRLRAEAGTAYKRHKKEPGPAYLLAYAEFKSGNLAGALSLAEEAARLAQSHPTESKDDRYQRTVAGLREGSPNPFTWSDKESKK